MEIEYVFVCIYVLIHTFSLEILFKEKFFLFYFILFYLIKIVLLL